jgi:hypothetical protein
MDMGAAMAIIRRMEEFAPRSSATIETREFIVAAVIKE